MVTISHVVKEILNRQIFLQEAINNDIVSFNKLANHLKPNIESILGKGVKHSAIVMAIRRHAEKSKNVLQSSKFSYFIETIKTDICYVTFEESSTLLPKIPTLYSIVDFKKGGILNIIQGNFELTIITNKRYEDELLDILHDEKVIQTIDDIVSISLIYSKEFLFIPGVLHDIVRLMAWENINILDIILTSTEMSIIIAKKDLMRCYEILGRFAEKRKEE
jgi:hypothetical protein